MVQAGIHSTKPVLNHVPSTEDLVRWQAACKHPQVRLVFRGTILRLTGMCRQDFEAIFTTNPRLWVQLDAQFAARLRAWVLTFPVGSAERLWAQGLENSLYQAVRELACQFGG